MNELISYKPVAPKAVFVLFTVIIIFSKCYSPENQIEKDNGFKKELSEKLSTINNEDSMLTILQKFVDEKNEVGKMICYKHLGSIQRSNARYPDAIYSHRQGLNIALQLNDTIEIVQAMNNLGINYIRIGAYNESSQHHYQALFYTETWSGADTPTGIENRSKSLNGIGNVSLLIGFYNDAEKKFRKALKYEIELNNFREQAINYANLGTVFEMHHQYDSAYVYYEKSLELSKSANSEIGVALSYISFGNLYEKKQQYDLAQSEYYKAYVLMERISNKWFWLKACLALARVNLTTGNIDQFNSYIQLAEKTANEIVSPEYLTDVYMLKHNFNNIKGNYKLALENYKQYIALQDSMQGKH